MRTEYPFVSYRGRTLPLPDAIMQTRMNPLTGKLYKKSSSVRTRLLRGFLRSTSDVERTFMTTVLASTQYHIIGTYFFVVDSGIRQLVRDVVEGNDITKMMHNDDMTTPHKALTRDQVVEQLSFFREYFISRNVDVLSLNR